MEGHVRWWSIANNHPWIFAALSRSWTRERTIGVRAWGDAMRYVCNDMFIDHCPPDEQTWSLCYWWFSAVCPARSLSSFAWTWLATCRKKTTTKTLSHIRNGSTITVLRMTLVHYVAIRCNACRHTWARWMPFRFATSMKRINGFLQITKLIGHLLCVRCWTGSIVGTLATIRLIKRMYSWTGKDGRQRWTYTFIGNPTTCAARRKLSRMIRSNRPRDVVSVIVIIVWEMSQSHKCLTRSTRWICIFLSLIWITNHCDPYRLLRQTAGCECFDRRK